MEVELANMADQEPLMSSRQEAEVTRRDIVEDKEDNKPTRFVWLLTVSAGISGLLFGCRYCLKVLSFY